MSDLNKIIKIQKIIYKKNHIDFNLPSWEGLASWKVIDQDNNFWEIDFRFVVSPEFFYQDLVDFGLNENDFKRKFNNQKKNKIILYYFSSNSAGTKKLFDKFKFDKKVHSSDGEKFLITEIERKYYNTTNWLKILRGLCSVSLLPPEIKNKILKLLLNN